MMADHGPIIKNARRALAERMRAYRARKAPGEIGQEKPSKPANVANPSRDTRVQYETLEQRRRRLKMGTSVYADVNGRQLIRLVNAALRANGQTRKDAKALLNAIERILTHLPTPYIGLKAQALRAGYYKALKLLPPEL